MSATASIESGVLAPDLREALRTLLSRKSQPYLEFPSTADAPGVCISTSYADLRRIIETEFQTKLDSRPIVPANYSAGGRRRLPDAPPPKRLYQDAGTQTKASPRPVIHTGQIESAPESRAHRSKRLRRAPVSRTICSSSTETESVVVRPARSQGLYLCLDMCFCANSHQHLLQPLVHVRGRRPSRPQSARSMDQRI